MFGWSRTRSSAFASSQRASASIVTLLSWRATYFSEKRLSLSDMSCAVAQAPMTAASFTAEMMTSSMFFSASASVALR